MHKLLSAAKIFSAAVLSLCLILFLVTCGGGAAGGAGGASLPDSEYTTHNPGGWGGGGSSGGGSSGGGSSGANSGETNVSVQGSTPLVVTGYSYGGQTYTSVEALTQAMTAGGATGTFTVPFTVAGGETRQARVTSTAEGFSLEHQYKATCVISTLANGDESTPVMYYANDGVNVTALNASNTAIIGWSANGTTHTENPVMGLQGDITLNAVFDLPACKITVTPPVNATETALDSGIYEITSIMDNFTFAVSLADGSPFPQSTSVTGWQVNGISAGIPGTTTNMSPADGGITDSAIGTNAAHATDLNVSCIVTIPGQPQAITVNKVIRVFKKITLPGFSITVTEPSSAAEAGTYGNPSGTRYAVTSLTDTFTLTAGSNITFPTGTTFNWTISAGGTPVTRTGQTVTVAPSDLGTISTVSTSPTEWLISCTASHADGLNTPNTNETIYLYKENPLKMTVSAPTGATPYTGGIYKITTMTDAFSFVATEEDGSSLPEAETTFQWYVGASPVSGETSATFNATPTALGLTEATMGTNQTNATEVEVKCLVTRASGAQVPVVKTIKVFKQLTLPTFSISVTKPTSATESTTDPGYYTVTSLTDTFSLSPSETFPTGTTFTWTITTSSGTITRTGQTITLGPTELVNPLSTSPTGGSISCVAHHDDATADVSDTKTIYLYKLPAVVITVVNGASEYSDTIYQIADLSQTITFRAQNDDNSAFPTGSSFEWDVNGVSVIYGGTYDDLVCTTSTLSLNASNIGSSASDATPVTMTFIESRPDGTITLTKEFKFFIPPVLPTSFDVTVTQPTTAGTTEPYAVYTNSDTFTFTASPSGGGSFPSGTKYDWEIKKGSETVVTRSNLTTASVNIQASEFGTISTDAISATTLTAKCTITNTATSNSPQDDQTMVDVYRYTIPNYTITFTPGTNSYDATHSDTSAAVPVYAMTDTTTAFTVQAVPTTGTFPDGTKFDWTVAGYSCNGIGQDGDTLSGLTFGGFGLSTLSTSSTSPTDIEITCTAHDDHNPALVTTSEVTKTVKVYEYVAETPVEPGMVSVTGGTDSNGNTIPNLLVCDHEVTQHEYETYCGYGDDDQPSEQYGVGTNYPAYFVSLYDAILYCNLRSVAENLDPCYYISGVPIAENTIGVEEGSGGKPRGQSSNNTTNNLVLSTNKYNISTSFCEVKSILPSNKLLSLFLNSSGLCRAASI